MATREEIREGLKDFFRPPSDTYQSGRQPILEENIGIVVDKLISYLHSQGCVIKVNRELPEPNETCPLMQGRLLAYNIELKKAGYVAVEPLVEE